MAILSSPNLQSGPNSQMLCASSFFLHDAAMERSLYPPVKRLLESLGFHVKGEIGSCDLVGIATRSGLL